MNTINNIVMGSIKAVSVYPGTYDQPADSELFAKRRRVPVATIKTHVEASEQEDSYEVHILAPGYAREDFLVWAHNNRLSIQATKRSDPRSKGKYFELEIPLPDEVDTDFVSAIYKDDLLNLYFLKTFSPGRKGNTQIIVY